jgi:hypothetical protein
MRNFIDALGESAVTFILDLSAYGWDITGSGWEAISPSGEIRAFATRDEAHAWRMAEVRDSLEWTV